MGFRNPFRVQVDENDVADISDYSPDAGNPQRSRGPAGVGRYEIDRPRGRLPRPPGGNPPGPPRTVGSPLAAVEVRQGSITGPIVATANLVSTGSTATMVWSSQTFPIAMSGKHELFLVFRTVTGGSTGNNLFNLNWIEFVGNGVTLNRTDVTGPVAGTVPTTLSLSLGTPASFGPFTAGVARTYNAQTTANVISTAGDATLSVADPSSNATGQMVNGTFSLPQALRARAASAGGTGGAFAPVGGFREPDHVAHVRRAGVQRRRDRLVRTGQRRQRCPQDGHLQQDADLQAVDHDTVNRGGARGRHPRARRHLDRPVSGLIDGNRAQRSRCAAASAVREQTTKAEAAGRGPNYRRKQRRYLGVCDGTSKL